MRSLILVSALVLFLPVSAAASADQYVISVAGPAIEGVPFDVTVQAVDASLNPIDDDVTVVTLAGFGDSTMLFDADGNGTFAAGDNAKQLTNGSLTIRARADIAGFYSIQANDGTAFGASDEFRVWDPNATHSFTFDPIGPQDAGIPFAITIRARDVYGNPKADFAGTVGLSVMEGATIVPTESSAFVAGVVTETVTIAEDGSWTLLAFDMAGPGQGTSAPFTVGTAPLHHFSFETIGTQTTGVPFSVTVTARDVNDGIIPGFNSTVDFQAVGGTLSPGISNAFTNGTLTQLVTFTGEGTARTITATASGSTESGTSNAFLVTGLTDHFTIDPIPVSWSAGNGFPITITAKDSNGNTVVGFTGTVDITVPGATAGYWNTVSEAFAAGVGVENVRIDSVGTYAVTVVRTSGTESGTSNSFSVAPAEPDRIIFAYSGPQQAGVPFSLVMTAEDSFANVATGFNGTVDFTVDAGTITPTASGAFVNGVRTETVMLDTAGNREITARFPATSYGGTYPVVVQPASATVFTIASIATQTAGTPFTVQITARDAFGNVDTSFTGTASLTSDGATIEPSTSANFIAGQLFQSITMTVAGTRTIVASDDGGRSGSSNAFTLAPASLHHFALEPIASQVAGVAFPITVTARDVYDNIVTGYVSTVGLSTDDGTISPTTSPAFTNGVLTTNVTLTKPGTRTITAANGPSGTSSPFTLAPGAVASFTIPFIGTQAAGVPFDVTITAKDALGNVATNFTGTAALSSGSALSPTTTPPFVAGVVTVSVTMQTAGDGHTLIVAGPATTTSNAFTINAGPLAHFTIDPIGAQIAGIPFYLTVQARDAYGNATLFNGVIDLTTNGATVSPASGAFSGTSIMWEVVLTAAGTRAITVTRSGGSETGTSNSFVVSARDVASLTIDPIGNQIAGVPFPISIKAYDALGNLATDFAATVALSTEFDDVLPATSDAFTNGTLTQSITLSRAGSRTLTVAGTSALATSNAFTVTPNIPDIALSTVTASPATVAADGVAAATVRVNLLDAFGNQLPGVAVALTAGGTATIGSPNPAMTDAAGVATFSVVSATANTVTFTASIPAHGLTLAQTPSVAFQSGAAATLRVTVAASSRIHTEVPVRIEVLDAMGNLAQLTGLRDVYFSAPGVSATSRDATGALVAFGYPSRLSFDAGLATTVVTFLAPGTFTIGVQVLSVDPRTSFPFEAFPGPAARFVFEQMPSSAILGKPLGAGRLRVVDAHGFLVPTFDASVTPVQLSACEVMVAPGRSCVFDQPGDFVGGIASLSQLVFTGTRRADWVRARTAGGEVTGQHVLVLGPGVVRGFTPDSVCNDFEGLVDIQVSGEDFVDGSRLKVGGLTLRPTIHNGTRMSATLRWSNVDKSEPVSIQVEDPWGNLLDKRTLRTLPSLVVTASNDGPTCVGNTAALSGTSSDPEAQMRWDGPLGFVATGPQASVVFDSPYRAGDYTLTISRRYCQPRSATTTVYAAYAPPSAIYGPYGVVELSTGNIASVETIAGATYSWSIENGTITAGQSTPQITWTAGNPGETVLRVDVHTGGTSGCTRSLEHAVMNLVCRSIPAPELIFPGEGASTGGTVRLQWTPNPDAAKYHLSVVGDNGASYARSVIWPWEQDSTKADFALPPGNYRWFVTAVSRCGDQKPSSMGTFTVRDSGSCAGPAPQLFLPNDAAVLTEDLVQFVWQRVEGAIGYLLHVDSASGALPPVYVTGEYGQIRPDSLRAFVRVPVEDDTFSWKIKPVFPGCFGSFSETRKASRPRCRAVPVPLSVEGIDKYSIGRTKVTFRWAPVPGASSYRLHLQTKDGFKVDFDSGIWNYPGVIDVGLDQSVTTHFWPGSDQVWFVEAVGSTCPNSFSPKIPLRTYECEDFPAPQLVAPMPYPGGIPVPSGQTTIEWKVNPQHVKAEVLMSVNGGMFAAVATSTTGRATIHLPPGDVRLKVRGHGSPQLCTADSAVVVLRVSGCNSISAPPKVSPEWTTGRKPSFQGTVEFNWFRELEVRNYTLIVGQIHQGTDYEIVNRVIDPNTSRIGATLQLGLRGEYWWKLRKETVEGCSVETPRYCFDTKLVLPCSSPIYAPSTVDRQPVLPASYTVYWTSSGVGNRYELVEYARPLGCGDCGYYEYARFTVDGTSKSFEHFAGEYRYDVRPLACEQGYVRQWSQTHVRVHENADGRLLEEAKRAIPFDDIGDAFEDAADWVGGLFGFARSGDPFETHAGMTFELTSSEPWLRFEPASGEWTPGMKINAIVSRTGLPPGTHQAMVTARRSDLPEPKTSIYRIELVPSASTGDADMPSQAARIVPIATHTPGPAGIYRSDLTLTNIAPEPRVFRIAFHATDGAVTTTGIQLAPGVSSRFNDILQNTFGVGEDESVFGYLSITETQGPDDPPANGAFVSSRIRMSGGDGDVGESVPVLEAADFASSGESIILAPISEDGDSRLNLGFLERSGVSVPVTIRVYDTAGQLRDELSYVVPGGRVIQATGLLASRGVTVTDGRIEIVANGPAALAAFASVIDRRSHDISLIAGRRTAVAGSDRALIPATTAVGGWSTDLFVTNLDTEPVAATLRWQPSSGAAPLTHDVQLQPGETRRLQDIVRTMFLSPGAFGTTFVEGPPNAHLLVRARTYVRKAQGGTAGQVIEGAAATSAIAVDGSPLHITGAEQSSRARTNLTLAEVSGHEAVVAVRVTSPIGEDSDRSFVLPPFGSLVIPSLIEPGSWNRRISVEVIGGDGEIVVSASTIDAASGDPIYVTAGQ